MSTSAVSGSSLYTQLQQYFQTRTSDVQQLGQALGSGDLAGAQTAFNAITTLGQSGPFASGDPFRNSTREQDFAAIGTALQSGNLGDAQQAFASLESTFHRSQGTTNPTPVAGPAPQPATGESNVGPAVVINLGSGGSTSALEATPSKAGPEIVLNLPSTSGGNSVAGTNSETSGSSSPSGPEIDINIGGGNSSSPEQVTIDIGSQTSGGGEQISIGVGNPDSSPEHVTLNLNANSNEQIVLNLLNGASGSSTSGGNINVSA
jgi:hypothetical protein